METEAKYYIPEIEEIIYQLTNVGEIFIVNSDTETLSKIQTHPDIPNTLVQFIRMNDVEAGKEGIKYSINPELYRIKYLDSEDIESLGGVKISDYEYNINGVILQINCSDSTHITILEIRQEWEMTAIPSKTAEYYFPLFMGKIKNKSELKKVLQMIGVL